MGCRELLELAAKAARIEPVLCYESARNCLRIGNRSSYRLWRPLTDDGDALRLAMSLELGVVCKLQSDHYETNASVVTNPYCVNQLRIVEPHRGDPGAATRIAIVRAAAEIGRAMP